MKYELHTNNNIAYICHYHVVFCPKYRRKVLVNGVDVGGKKLKFLRRIPTDPIAGNTDWGLRSVQDDPNSDSWDGNNVFDVYTKSLSTALDGTKYKDW